MDENRVLKIYTIVDYENQEVATIKITDEQGDAMAWLANFLGKNVGIVPFDPVTL